MKLVYLEDVIFMRDDWDKIKIYTYEGKDDKKIDLSINRGINRKHLTIPIKDYDSLHIYPFSPFTYERHEKLARVMWRVGDLVCAFLSNHVSLSLDELIGNILKYKSKYNIDELSTEWILRCLTARGIVIAKCNNGKTSFSLSPTFRLRENERKFSATIAVELESLSERVRCIVNHGPSVGTYRENLLQSILRKHLPERYHIATGFIFGTNKQIDILIYDRVDYAPVFREGDLVVVPPESVRAVIEVKTELTSCNLKSALELIDLVTIVDDNKPPFFKGIFAFESQLTVKKINKEIADFYTDWNVQAQGGPGVLICQPFQHITCVCVNNKMFSYTKYNRNENHRLVPMLYSRNSATKLQSQCSFFVQSLLSYLKFGGMKPFKLDYMDRMLGEDSYAEKIKDLREGDDSWAAYYSYDEGYIGEDEVKNMESLICSAQCWIDGEDNYETINLV